MNTNPWTRAIATFAIAAFLATGCTSLESVPLDHSTGAIARPDVKVGESVVVTKKDGSKERFRVTSVDDDALAGGNVHVPYSDMSALEVVHGDGSPSKKALLIGAVVLGLGAVAAASGGGHGGGGY